MKRLIIIALAALVSACTPSPEEQRMRDQEYSATTVNVNDSGRVNVERIGIIRDNLAYDNKRGIYLITDKETGQQFIGISGVGISALASHQSGKTRVTDER